MATPSGKFYADSSWDVIYAGSTVRTYRLILDTAGTAKVRAGTLTGSLSGSHSVDIEGKKIEVKRSSTKSYKGKYYRLE